MEIKKRGQDLTEIFNSRWNVNHDYQGRKEFFDNRKEHFNKMYNIKEKETNIRRQEILRANSVDGKLENLNQRMEAVKSNERMTRMNNFKNNFR